MKTNFVPLVSKQKLYDGFRQSFAINNKNILLIQENSLTYLIENKCGHFGVKLDVAMFEEKNNMALITCKQHGISFNLSSGEVVNRPWENCDPIKVLAIKVEAGMLGFEDYTQLEASD